MSVLTTYMAAALLTQVCLQAVEQMTVAVTAAILSGKRGLLVHLHPYSIVHAS